MSTNIVYSEVKDIEIDKLLDLFNSVSWNSAKYPERLQLAIKNSHSVVSAWEGDKLIGLMNCISDGYMTAYFHYLLVNPDYQGMGIGKTIVQKMLSKYDGLICNFLISYENKVGFYEDFGFEKVDDQVPLYITKIKL